MFYRLVLNISLIYKRNSRKLEKGYPHRMYKTKSRP